MCLSEKFYDLQFRHNVNFSEFSCNTKQEKASNYTWYFLSVIDCSEAKSRNGAIQNPSIHTSERPRDVFLRSPTNKRW
jgi:hypothetical protein